MSTILLYLTLCYFCGSLPFGLWFGFWAGKDIRREGSGNIGFTNVLRVCGAKFGVPVLLLDALKGFVPVFWLAPMLFSTEIHDYYIQQALGGMMVMAGHSFPVWLKFRGGKGVATGAGVAAAIIPYPLIIALLTWLIVLLVWRYVSLSSLSAAITTLAGQIWLTWGKCFDSENLSGLILASMILVLVWTRHRSNIMRLLNGTENKIWQKE